MRAGKAAVSLIGRFPPAQCQPGDRSYVQTSQLKSVGYERANDFGERVVTGVSAYTVLLSSPACRALLIRYETKAAQEPSM